MIMISEYEFQCYVGAAYRRLDKVRVSNAPLPPIESPTDEDVEPVALSEEKLAYVAPPVL